MRVVGEVSEVVEEVGRGEEAERGRRWDENDAVSDVFSTLLYAITILRDVQTVHDEGADDSGKVTEEVKVSL